MNYSKLRKQLKEKRQEVTKAQAKLIELESDKKVLFEDFEKSYEALTDAKARLNVGDGSKKEVDRAEKRNKKLKKQIEQIKDDIQVQERTITLLREKVAELSGDFSKQAVQYHKEKLEPIYGQISDAVDNLQESFEQLQRQKKELQKDNLQAGQFMLGLHREPGIYFNKNRVPGIIGKDFISSTKLQENIERITQ